MCQLRPKKRTVLDRWSKAADLTLRRVKKTGKLLGDPRSSSIIVTDGQTAGVTQETDHIDITRLSVDTRRDYVLRVDPWTNTVTLNESEGGPRLKGRNVVARGRRDGVHHAFVKSIRLQHKPLYIMVGSHDVTRKSAVRQRTRNLVLYPRLSADARRCRVCRDYSIIL
jgi:hypothetical protein